MDAKVRAYINSQPSDRHALLAMLHEAIEANDPTVTPVVEPMMRQEMIIYKKGTMKYALASSKQYLSLHVLPIYGDAALHAKYQALLPKARFQKGCINFVSADEMPADIAAQLIRDCAGIDLQKMREEQLASRKAAKKKGG